MDTNETKIYISVLIGLTVLIILVTFFIVTIARYQRRKVAFHLESVKAGFDLLDEERQRISSDLHDDLGSSLSLVKLRLQSLKNLNAENVAIVDISESEIDQSMHKLRRISYNMMPGVLQRQGLDKALKELIDIISDSINITIDYQCDVDFSQEKAIHIYRISQEILNNVVKHSKATLVNFTILKAKNKIAMRIKDNGIGFNKNMLAMRPRRLGLYTISARADLLKATIFLTASHGKGVEYLIEIPV